MPVADRHRVDVRPRLAAPSVGAIGGPAAAGIMAMSVAIRPIVVAGFGHGHDREETPSLRRRKVHI